jgi:D-alanine-D-alanine ligase
MTRIGFAYNLKPAAPGAAPAPAPGEPDVPAAEEEPPSRRGESAARGAATAAPPLSDVYAEWDAPETIDAVARALAPLGTVVRLEATEEFPERLRRTRPDIVFNIAEGLHGVNRESHVPAICEFFGVPYSGSDPFTLALCLDKARTKETLAFHGIPTAPFRVARDGGESEQLLSAEREAPSGPALGARRSALQFPLFVKPLHEGSSKGITERNLCRAPDELRAAAAFLLERYAQPVLVEEYLPGAEFTCAVLGNGASARVLPIVGMNFAALPAGALPVYGYEAKWLWDRPENPLDMFACPAPVGAALARDIERVTLAAYRVLGCRDWTRVDVRLDAAGVPNVIEVNPLPGILPDPADNSCFPKAARAAGMTYDDLIQSCLRAAAARQGVRL